MSKFWISIASGVPFAATFLYHFHTASAWGMDLSVLCTSPSPLTGIGVIDWLLCHYVQVFTYALRDPLGSDITWLLLGHFGTVLVLMALESARRGRAMSPLLWGLAMNFFGVSIIFPLFWVPLFYKREGRSSWYVAPSRANGILVAFLAGYVVPTVAMVYLTLQTPGNKWLEEAVIALWQFAPLWLSPLYELASSSLACLDDPGDPRLTDESRQRIRVADSKTAIERMYVLIGLLNVLLYYTVYVRTKVQGLLSWEAIVDLIATPDADLSLEQLAHYIFSHLLFTDFAGLCVVSVWWAILEDGLLGGLITLLGSLVVGPGAAFAFYLAYREGRVQNLKMMIRKDQ